MVGEDSRTVSAGERPGVSPEYFALRVRQAYRSWGPSDPEMAPECYGDEPLEGVTGPEPGDLIVGAGSSLEDHPEVVEADVEISDASASVMRAEDLGQPDEVAMRRLDAARRKRRRLLVRLQRQRAVTHTRQAEFRTAQVVPMRRFAVVRGEAA